MNLQEDGQDKEESSTEDTEDNYSCDEHKKEEEKARGVTTVRALHSLSCYL